MLIDILLSFLYLLLITNIFLAIFVLIEFVIIYFIINKKNHISAGR